MNNELPLYSTSPTRIACVYVKDWPLVSALEIKERAGETVPDASAVMDKHRVLCVSAAAYRAGVREGMKKRAAEALCPQILLMERDTAAEWTVFETVAAAVDTVASGVELLDPGMLLMQARGPARHAGGEEALVSALIDAVADRTGWECFVGIADSPLAAILASHSGRIVNPGESERFLAPFPIHALHHAPIGQSVRFTPAHAGTDSASSLSEFIDLLIRLGITSLGSFAALPAHSVLERFGNTGLLLHTLARASEPSDTPRTRPEQPLIVERSADPPLERVDQAAFIARPMAEELEAALRSRGMVCTRLRIIGRTEDGEETERTWRHDGALSVNDVVDRVRWQCDAWIRSAQLTSHKKEQARVRTGAIVHLQLIPLQLLSATEHAPGLWGSTGAHSQRAMRALTRVQSIAGEQSVLMAHEQGGRLLSQKVTALAFRTAPAAFKEAAIWARIDPMPAPSTVFSTHPNIEILSAQYEGVYVSARGILTDSPRYARITVPKSTKEEPAPALPNSLQRLAGEVIAIQACSAPVLIDQAWWGPVERAFKGARMQILLATGDALIVLSRQKAWMIEAIYD